ncbi:hypothetical protein [Croceivirga sp. JEA036]|uniref:hypothetical protein n=1 Tax=Croceivirga sp. JEA036 TaxID=2721162 RepID=UPI00143A050A|nr:hypothetical protein [Croceivirga sp. JEA036]NJB38208.1 hypothetical protein [Croceivirga sp. JEA036]
MKKIAICFLLYNLIISCNCNNRGDQINFLITDFTKQRVDTLVPYKNKSYITYYIKIKGKVNDTIKIQRKDYGHYFILPGHVDTLLNGDYYGTENIIWTFDPYKATKGELKIEYSL